jgi:hypothetical protein
MQILIWITATFAPAALRQLLMRLVWGIMQHLRARIASRTADWSRLHGMPGLALLMQNDLRMLETGMEWIERIVNLIIWLRARELCGVRSKLNIDLDFAEVSHTPTVASLYARLKNAERRLATIEDSATRMAEQWTREKHRCTLPPLAGEVARRVDGGESQGGSLEKSPLGSPPSRLCRTSPASGGRAHLCFAARGPPARSHPENKNPRHAGPRRRDRGRTRFMLTFARVIRQHRAPVTLSA